MRDHVEMEQVQRYQQQLDEISQVSHSRGPTKESKDYSNFLDDETVNETAAFNPITYSQGKMAKDFYSSQKTEASNQTVSIRFKYPYDSNLEAMEQAALVQQ